MTYFPLNRLSISLKGVINYTQYIYFDNQCVLKASIVNALGCLTNKGNCRGASLGQKRVAMKDVI